MEIKDLIRYKRKQMGYTQRELGMKVGVSGPTIARYESGEITEIRRNVIVSLSRELEIPATTLMGWDEQRIKQVAAATDAFSSLRHALEALVLTSGIRSMDDIKGAGLEYLQNLAMVAMDRYIQDISMTLDK